MARNQIPVISWIHLSDLHQSHGDAATIIDQDLVMRQLISDCKRIFSDNKLPPPLLIFSGDVANKGHEYSNTRKLFEDFRREFRLADGNFLIVPGNHDVQRDAEIHDSNTRRLLDELWGSSGKLDNALANSNDRELLLNRLQNFSSFSKEYHKGLLFDQYGLAWKTELEPIKGLKLRFIGLNSSLLSRNNDDKENLQIGNHQIQFALDNPEDSNCIKVAIFHHPISWLRDKESVQRWLASQCSVLINGHEHMQDLTSIQQASGHGYIHIEAGSCHTTENGTVHSYNVGAIYYAEETGEKHLRIFPRKWVDSFKDFRVDLSAVPKDKSFSDHPLERNSTNSSATGRFVLPQKDDSEQPFLYSSDSPCDAPPEVTVWVGRQMESDLLVDSSMKVVAITGIGGQGKSALAGRFIEKQLDGTSWLWDWRDCKEEGDKLQTQLLQIISRFSDGENDFSTLIEEPISTLIELFFKTIENKKIVFVFDNIDHYVDTENKQATLGMKLLMDAALNRRHSSRFIFTCRPRLVSDNPQFYNIALEGLSLAETMELFIERGVSLEDPSLKRNLAEIHRLTNGHTLWLNLIATQTAKDRANLDWLTKDIKKGVDAGLPTPTLRSIWLTLNENQRNLLRFMAEMVCPETEEKIAHILRDDISYAKVTRSLRQLNDLALIVVKALNQRQKVYELHPLVRAFIVQEFTRSERIPFIDRIAQFVDSIIALISKKPPKEISYSMIEYFIHRAELAINRGDYKSALKSIQQAAPKLLGEGYQVEFIRIARRAFEVINMNEAILQEYPYFDSVLYDLVEALSLHGRFSETQPLLSEYEGAIAGNSARFIHLCNMQCHTAWVMGEYSEAVKWGTKGKRQKDSTGIDTQFDCSHNLALAQRDSGQVDEALEYFLAGADLDKVVLDNKDDKRGGSYFGNIGRCLWLMGDHTKALNCLVISARLLISEESNPGLVNRGWAAFWIAEVLETKGDLVLAATFFRRAQYIWENAFPTKSKTANQRFQQILVKLPERDAEICSKMPEDDVQVKSDLWLSEYILAAN